MFRKKLNLKCQVRGFTLIELLVVIAIIALLLSILMPSLKKAKKIAQTVVCSSNMRTLSIASLAYAADNEDKIVLCVNTNGDLWLGSLEPYYGDPDIKICPSVKKVADLTPRPSSDTSLGPLGGRMAKIDPVDGSCYESWWAQTLDLYVHTSSYGMNGYAQWFENAKFMKNTKELYWGRISESMAYSIPLIVPDIWRSGYPARDSSSVTFSDVPGECSNGVGIGRFIFIRHDDRNNVSFIDGHVERVYLPDMGTLKWHREWESIVFDIPWLQNRP